ncbi:DUF427 domain-containing protein [Spongisporangium articulatum]|uniref:DUF427 domain-containing protein n=1 Tax=Spongisporangium articulatum TaxID=3362603 RepID=A0ABW8AL25_9ACTN
MDDDRDYPQMAAEVDLIEPAPRRVRGMLGGAWVFDTTRALYVWEWPNYPQYYIPLEDVDGRYLVDEHHEQRLRRGTARRHGLRVGTVERPASVRVFGDDALPGLAGHVRFDWAGLDAWYEEDEQVFVHPRNPYVRVDCLRSSRPVRVELDGVLLAESSSPVMLYETGLPTRYYLDRTALVTEHLTPSPTQTACPYKGVTSGYWNVEVGGRLQADLAWTYDFPAAQVLPIAGLVAFYNEKVDIWLDGVAQPRPRTHFFR